PPGSALYFIPNDQSGNEEGSYGMSSTGDEHAPSLQPCAVFLNLVTCPQNDFALAAKPQSLTLLQGRSGSVQIQTSIAQGYAEAISLDVSGVPAGASASLSPQTVAAGIASTLSVSAGVAPPGVYTLTVTGTAASGAHSVPVSLTILAP